MWAEVLERLEWLPVPLIVSRPSILCRRARFASVAEHIHESVLLQVGWLFPLILLMLPADVCVVLANVAELYVVWFLLLLPHLFIILLLLLIM